MNKLAFLLLAFLSVTACKDATKDIDTSAISSESIFHLTSSWQNQHGSNLHLRDLQGKTLVVVMIYTTCKIACPILVADMKKIEQKIRPELLDDVSLVLVSIDPETDTPETLHAFAKTNGMDADHWVFLRSDEAATQEFANVLAMKYKKISPIDFSHSNIISIFSKKGDLVVQEEGLGINSDKIANKVNEMLN